MQCLTAIFLIFNFFASTSATLQQPDDVKPAALITSLEKARFTVSAAIYFGLEDETEIPVEGKFYLLNQSVVTILKKAKFDPVDENDLPLSGETDYLEAVANTFAEKNDESNMLAYLIREAVESRQITAVETDRFGIGKSKVVRAGNYFLFAVEKVEDEIFVWNLPVHLSGGNAKIEIDQYNAESTVAVASMESDSLNSSLPTDCF